jgi:lysophospholipase L1-like esterase
MASVPVGVRLELLAKCDEIEIRYRTPTGPAGRPWAAPVFSLWREAQLVDERPAPPGEGSVRLRCSGSKSTVTIHLPEGLRPEVLDVVAVGGTIEPAPTRPRWVCYGDSIAEGWVASRAAGAWPAIVARRLELDLVNMGYAGAARGEAASAEHVASLAADVIAFAYGTNCWTRVPFDVDTLRAGLEAFHRIVRVAHPDTPIMVVSPILRPDAEREPNVLGASLNDLREAMEEVATRWIDEGEPVRLVGGLSLVAASRLADGVHPNDDGHRSMADAIEPALRGLLTLR